MLSSRFDCQRSGVSSPFEHTLETEGTVRIRHSTEIPATNAADCRGDVMEAIRELEQQHEEGEIETPAYLIKKRSLVRML